jgi:hypothetical protein
MIGGVQELSFGRIIKTEKENFYTFSELFAVSYGDPSPSLISPLKGEM